jgi:hypothetical protein
MEPNDKMLWIVRACKRERRPKNYRQADPYEHKACAYGVVKDRDCWGGVVNYFHSNT